MACQARILDKEFIIPGTKETCHTTKECGLPSSRGVRIDDGESEMRICKECTKRFITKASKKDYWYGWFDCTYPDDSKIKFSPWYYKVLKEVAASASASASSSEVKEEAKAEVKIEIKAKPQSEVAAITKKIATMTIVPAKSKKEMLLQQIEEIKVWIKGEGKAKPEEQPKMLKKFKSLQEQLKMLSTP
jgi:transcriptional regulator NrdR family protein